tara:strand:+ start:760 stop:2334 length:1575 start_codon:yes stop_codon:yes gene_type:complete
MGRCGTLLICLTSLLLGCSDYSLQKKVEYAPEIIVTPDEHDFGVLNAADPETTITFRIQNIGNDSLNINSNYLEYGDPRFQLNNTAVGTLEPGEETELLVSYDPITFEENDEYLIINSNDEDESRIAIPLIGQADAPVIDVTPTVFDFGEVDVGCEDSTIVTIENIGNVDLEVSLVDYYASLPVDLGPSDYEVDYGEFPWTIAPAETRDIEVYYVPTDLHADGGWLEISSNDPVNPSVAVDQIGIGSYESIITDKFDQDGMMGSDILFVIDNSGSMCGNQTQLANNFDTFINILSASGYDYQIAFITTDDYNFVGDIITPLTPDPVSEAASQITGIGCHGSAHEKGMDMSWNATMGTGDAAPGSAFLRDDAKLVVIYLSDEDDFSTVSPSTMAGRLASLKTSTEFSVAHAVAGDVPGGCTSNGGAQAGNDYYDLVNLTGGTFLSICAEDWGTPMEELARESLAVSAFYLSDQPIEDTISVEVDGAISSDWSYDPSINAVVFSVIPPEGSEISVDYAVWACQEEE